MAHFESVRLRVRVLVCTRAAFPRKIQTDLSCRETPLSNGVVGKTNLRMSIEYREMSVSRADVGLSIVIIIT